MRTPLTLYLPHSVVIIASIIIVSHAGQPAAGRCNTVVELPEHYHPNYYAAFVKGPDGHNIEAVCHKPEG